MIWTPPNGYLFFLFFFKEVSIASKISAETIDASSIIKVSNLVITSRSLSSLTSSFVTKCNGNLKNECIVSPLAFKAVIP